MVSNDIVRTMALAFPERSEAPHFERLAFKVKKKIFATFSAKDRNLSLKLSLVDQSVFCKIDPVIIFPVPGGWGRMGFTFVNLKKIKKALLLDALTAAYCNVAPPKLAEKFLRD